MQYGTKHPTGPWSMTLRVGREPRCPGCAQFLQPAVTVIREGWAWCGLCVDIALHCEPHLLFAMNQDAMYRHVTCCSGVRFYTPQEVYGEAKNALDYYEQWVTVDQYALIDASRDAIGNMPPAAADPAADPGLLSPA